MQESNPLQTNTRQPNKGFRVWVGDTYVGYLNIGEKGVAVETIKSLQNPEVMAKVLAKAELRPYTETRDTADVDAIITQFGVEKAMRAQEQAEATS